MSKDYCDLALDYFNGNLDEQEKEKFEEHLLTCEECREEVQLWNSFIEELPYQVEPLTPPTGMKERVLSSIFENDELLASESKPLKLAQSSQTPAKSTLRWMMPAMAAALLLSLAGNAYLYNNQHETNTATERKESIDKTVSYVSLAPVEGKATGTASLVKHGQKMNVVIQASQLKQLKNKEVYQVWLLEGKKPYRAGTFVTGSTGEGSVIFQLDNKMNRNWDTVAITLEPDANSQTPKGNIVLASKL